MIDYPETREGFESRFETNGDCLEYLHHLRWKDGFICPKCGGREGWKTTKGLWLCKQGRHRVSVTSGSFFHRTRIPLINWFKGIWYVTEDMGVNVRELQTILNVESYRIALKWMHKLRDLDYENDCLSGCIRMHMTKIGDLAPDIYVNKPFIDAYVIIAGEFNGDIKLNKIALKSLRDPSIESVSAFIGKTIETGSVLQTDLFKEYWNANKTDYTWERIHPNEIESLYKILLHIKLYISQKFYDMKNPIHLEYFLERLMIKYNNNLIDGKHFYNLLKRAVSISL